MYFNFRCKISFLYCLLKYFELCMKQYFFNKLLFVFRMPCIRHRKNKFLFTFLFLMRGCALGFPLVLGLTRVNSIFFCIVVDPLIGLSVVTERVKANTAFVVSSFDTEFFSLKDKRNEM